MEKSKLKPFIRENLDILFVGLNPSNTSNKKNHYFSTNQAFWTQLYQSGIITKEVDKNNADELIFASTSFNLKNWSYGITDLVLSTAESDSKKIHPTYHDCELLLSSIKRFNPKVIVLLHSKVLRYFLPFLGVKKCKSNTGSIGKIITGFDILFFNIAFPHGNKILSNEKIHRYKEIINYLNLKK